MMDGRTSVPREDRRSLPRDRRPPIRQRTQKSRSTMAIPAVSVLVVVLSVVSAVLLIAWRSALTTTPSYKLTYFNLRGRGETPRIIMAYGGIEYEDVRIPYPEDDEWAKLKPTAPFGQMPILEVDGVQICQSHAISRFLAKKIGLHGQSDIDEAKIDMVVGCFEDMLTRLDAMFRETDETKMMEMEKACQQALADSLYKFENFIEGDFFLGNQMSWADIFVSEGLGFFSALGLGVSLDKAPKLAGLVDRVQAQPEIAAWIAKRPKTEL